MQFPNYNSFQTCLFNFAAYVSISKLSSTYLLFIMSVFNYSNILYATDNGVRLTQIKGGIYAFQMFLFDTTITISY